MATFAEVMAGAPKDAPPLAFPLAVTAGRNVEWLDLQKTPHILFAGTTGSGKSVGLNVAIGAIMERNDPEDVRFLMIDPKRVELSAYDEAGHVNEVITDMPSAAQAIKGLVAEMDDRYQTFQAAGVRKIEDYRKKTGEHMPYIILVVDELSNLMDMHAKTVLDPLVTLGQLARAAGIHMMLATQRPAADTIPKKLLANVPTRVAFKCQSHTESRLVLGVKGAESLRGEGHLKALLPGLPELVEGQGPFIDDDEVLRIVERSADAAVAAAIDESEEALDERPKPAPEPLADDLIEVEDDEPAPEPEEAPAPVPPKPAEPPMDAIQALALQLARVTNERDEARKVAQEAQEAVQAAQEAQRAAEAEAELWRQRAHEARQSQDARTHRLAAERDQARQSAQRAHEEAGELRQALQSTQEAAGHFQGEAERLRNENARLIGWGNGLQGKIDVMGEHAKVLTNLAYGRKPKRWFGRQKEE